MNREDIIRMAREAGLPIFDAAAVANDPAEQAMADIVTKVWHDSAERFAALVAAAEREKVAAWMIQRGYATGHGDTTEDLLKELDWQVLANWSSAMKTGAENEREACAQIAEEPSATTYECTVVCGGPAQTFTQRLPKDAHEIAKTIRARGQA